MDEKNRTEPMLLGMVYAAGTRRRCPAVSASFDQQSGYWPPAMMSVLSPVECQRLLANTRPMPPDSHRRPSTTTWNTAVYLGLFVGAHRRARGCAMSVRTNNIVSYGAFRFLVFDVIEGGERIQLLCNLLCTHACTRECSLPDILHPERTLTDTSSAPVRSR